MPAAPVCRCFWGVMIARPSVDVNFTYEDDSTNSATANFDLVGKDGKSLLDPNGDFDGDGHTNREEIEKNTNPADAQDKPDTAPGIDTGKCVATTLGFGLPLIALLPIGLATQIDLPGLTPIANEVSARLEQTNSQIQQQLGVFNPQMAGQVAEVNARLKEVGADLAMVAAGIALIAAGILAGTLIYDNCAPGGGFNSSVKDAKLKGSSGKEYTLSS